MRIKPVEAEPKWESTERKLCQKENRLKWNLSRNEKSTHKTLELYAQKKITITIEIFLNVFTEFSEPYTNVYRYELGE